MVFRIKKRSILRLIDISMICVACCGSSNRPGDLERDPNDKRDDPAAEHELVKMKPYEEATSPDMQLVTLEECETRCDRLWHVHHPGKDSEQPSFKTRSRSGAKLFKFLGQSCRATAAAYTVFYLEDDGSECSQTACVEIAAWNIVSYNLEIVPANYPLSMAKGVKTADEKICRSHAGLTIETTPENWAESHGDATISWSLRPHAVTTDDEKNFRKWMKLGDAPVNFFYPEYVSRRDVAAIGATAMATSFQANFLHDKPWGLACAEKTCAKPACAGRPLLCPLVIDAKNFAKDVQQNGGDKPFDVNSLVSWQHPDLGSPLIEPLTESTALAGRMPNLLPEGVGGLITFAGIYKVPAYVILTYLVSNDIILTAVVKVSGNATPEVIETTRTSSLEMAMLPDQDKLRFICNESALR